MLRSCVKGPQTILAQLIAAVCLCDICWQVRCMKGEAKMESTSGDGLRDPGLHARGFFLRDEGTDEGVLAAGVPALQASHSFHQLSPHRIIVVLAQQPTIFQQE